jgi:hypothetical protein
MILQYDFVPYFSISTQYIIWSDLFLDHCKGHNCAEMYFVMHFRLNFGFGFYNVINQTLYV